MISQRKSRPPSLNNSPMIGPTVGRALRLPRSPPTAKRPSAMSVNGRSRSPPFLSLKAKRASWRRAKLPTTPSPHPLPPPLASVISPLLSNMRSNIKKVVTAEVVMSSFWRMASRIVARSFPIPLLGLSCSVLTLLARAPR